MVSNKYHEDEDERWNSATRFLDPRCLRAATLRCCVLCAMFALLFAIDRLQQSPYSIRLFL